MGQIHWQSTAALKQLDLLAHKENVRLTSLKASKQSLSGSFEKEAKNFLSTTAEDLGFDKPEDRFTPEWLVTAKLESLYIDMMDRRQKEAEAITSQREAVLRKQIDKDEAVAGQKPEELLNRHIDTRFKHLFRDKAGGTETDVDGDKNMEAPANAEGTEGEADGNSNEQASAVVKAIQKNGSAPGVAPGAGRQTSK